MDEASLVCSGLARLVTHTEALQPSQDPDNAKPKQNKSLGFRV